MRSLDGHPVPPHTAGIPHYTGEAVIYRQNATTDLGKAPTFPDCVVNGHRAVQENGIVRCVVGSHIKGHLGMIVI